MLPTYACALVLGCWTLAYHGVLITGLPARWIALPFLLLAGGVIWASRAEWGIHRETRRERGPLLATLAFACVTGSAAMFIAVFNPDDVNYLHRALVQLDHLAEPIEPGQSFYAGLVLPPLTTAHGLTSHELLVVVGANLVGLDPLWAYHKLGEFLGHVLFAFVYVALYRQLGLAPWKAFIATATAFTFCFSDVNFRGRSYGNVQVALYNGKILLWGVGLPMLLLLAHRFLSNPSRIRLLWVGLGAVAIIGLSGSGIFLGPALLGAAGAAHFLAERANRNALLRAASLQAASLYGISIGMAGVLGLLERPSDLSIFDGFPSDWLGNLALVTDHPTVLARDVALLIGAPMLALAAREARFLVLLSAVLAAVLANGLTGPILIELLTPGAYWRIAYLFPVIVTAGLLVEAITRSARTGTARRLLAWALPILVFVAFVQARDWPFPAAGGRVAGMRLGAAGAVRLPPVHVRFAEKHIEKLRGRRVLASSAAFPSLALLDPTLRFEDGRWARHSFANSGDVAGGLRRELAGSVVTHCMADAARREAFRQSLRLGVDALVVGPCFQRQRGRATIFGLLLAEGDAWSPPIPGPGFTLFLREPHAPEP